MSFDTLLAKEFTLRFDQLQAFLERGYAYTLGKDRPPLENLGTSNYLLWKLPNLDGCAKYFQKLMVVLELTNEKRTDPPILARPVQSELTSGLMQGGVCPSLRGGRQTAMNRDHSWVARQLDKV